MKKVFYYIGSNNKTKELEVDKAVAIISEHFTGFTAFEVIGFWKGLREKTLKVEIVTEEENVKLAKIGRELKEKLEQESVLMEIINSNIAFIQ